MPTPSNKPHLRYTPIGGISAAHRGRLIDLHRRARGPFRSGEAANWLGLPLPRARRLLSYLSGRGWLVRAAQGLYALVPLEAGKPREWREEPWLVASRAFAPAYVGGWSACEHWGLTDQVFNAVCIYTARRVRTRSVEMQRTKFLLKTVAPRKVFGLTQVWIRGTPVRVSDPARTLVDVLDDPRSGGGIRHVADVVDSYFHGEHVDERRLLDYAVRFGNGAVFKRLGYLAEALKVGTPSLIAECARRRSTGIAWLDPTIRARGRILSRWSLRVNAGVAGGR